MHSHETLLYTGNYHGYLIHSLNQVYSLSANNHYLFTVNDLLFIHVLDTGDISEQKAIRTKLNCKSFKWFMETVLFDINEYYPPVEPEPYAGGEVSVTRSYTAYYTVISNIGPYP